MSNNDTSPKYRRQAAKESAKALRKALKAAFPGVKFSVTGSRGTGHGWYSVSYTDGPTADKVEAITNDFEGASFDGMTDMLSLINTPIGVDQDGTPLVSGMKGIHVNRELSDGFVAPFKARLIEEGYSASADYIMDGAARMFALGAPLGKIESYWAIRRAN